MPRLSQPRNYRRIRPPRYQPPVVDRPAPPNGAVLALSLVKRGLASRAVLGGPREERR